jgi:hypothetical protein
MGTLTYDSEFTVDFDDRLLAHLQIVIGTKLRRGESCLLSRQVDARNCDGRTAIWLHPSISLIYKYYGGRMPRVNRLWIDQLASTANSTSGLQVVPEPEMVAPENDGGTK